MSPDYNRKKVYVVHQDATANKWLCFSLEFKLPGVIVRSAFSPVQALEMMERDKPIDFVSLSGESNYCGEGRLTLVEELISRELVQKDKIVIFTSVPSSHQELAERTGVGLLLNHPFAPYAHSEYVAKKLA